MESSQNSTDPWVSIGVPLGLLCVVALWVQAHYIELIAVLVTYVLFFVLIVGIIGPYIMVWLHHKRREERLRNEEYERKVRKEREAKEREERRVKREKEALTQRYYKRVKEQKEAEEERARLILTEKLYPCDGSSDLTSDEFRSLWATQGYTQHKFVPIGKQKPERFLIKNQPPESPEHTFVVLSIAKLLEGRVQDIKTYAAVNADIIFWYKGKDYAFEIETPLGLRQKKGRLRVKANWNDYEYVNRWWFVVTRSAYKRSFTKYGKVLTRNQVLPFINKHFPMPPSASAPPLINIVQRNGGSKVCKSRRQKRKSTR